MTPDPRALLQRLTALWVVKIVQRVAELEKAEVLFWC